jgi:hypothetical protein
MLALISLRNFARTGHIDTFRSIVGDAGRGEKFFVRPPPGGQNISPEPTRPSGSKTDPNERSDAYLHLLLCEQLQGAARGGIGDGSRLYPAPILGLTT